MRDAAEAGDHPDHHERGTASAARPGGHRERRQTAAPRNPPITMPGPKMPPEPPGPIDSDVARIFANGRRRTIHNGRVRMPSRHRHLDPAVPRPEDLRHRERHQADQEPADRGLDHPAARESPGQTRHAVERRRVEAAEQPGRDADQGVVARVRPGGRSGSRPGVPKIGGSPRPRRRSRTRRSTPRARGSRRPASTSSRYRTSAPRIAPPSGARKIAPMPEPMPTVTAIRASLGVRFEPTGQHRAEPGADLRGRALAAGRPARSDRDRRRDDLHERDARPDARAGCGARPRSRRPCRGPPPRAPGGRRAIPEIRPPSPTTSGIAHGRANSRARAEGRALAEGAGGV